jgi:hypothetical protein
VENREVEAPMSSVQIEQKTYEMPPREGLSIAHFLTVADIERSARYYEKVFGARILSLGDGNAPAYLQLANIWMILNVGGGPTADKPTVTLSVPDRSFPEMVRRDRGSGLFATVRFLDPAFRHGNPSRLCTLEEFGGLQQSRLNGEVASGTIKVTGGTAFCPKTELEPVKPLPDGSSSAFRRVSRAV